MSLFSPVMTTRPPLPTALNALPTTSASARPTVMIAESAPWPRVTSVTLSWASAAFANACVAPSSRTLARLFSSGSTVIRYFAPYWPRGPEKGNRSPGQVALQDRGAHVADRLPSGRAVPAYAAVRNERGHHVATGLDPGHAWAHLLDDPGALVPEDHRQPGLQVTVRHMDIGVAETGVGVADENFAVFRPVEFQLLDLDWLAGLVDDRGLGFRGRSFRPRARPSTRTRIRLHGAS